MEFPKSHGQLIPIYIQIYKQINCMFNLGKVILELRRLPIVEKQSPIAVRCKMQHAVSVIRITSLAPLSLHRMQRFLLALFLGRECTKNPLRAAIWANIKDTEKTVYYYYKF